MLLQTLRLTLKAPLTLSAPAVATLRQHIFEAGANRQYAGYIAPAGSTPLPKQRHEACWLIEWPSDDGDIAKHPTLLKELGGLTQDETKTLALEFHESRVEELRRGIEAPICEFAFIRLSPAAPLSSPELQTSLVKTFTDSYGVPGFVGGEWGHTVDSNESAGVPVSGKERLDQGERRLALYLLGWESIELHQDYTKTPLFAKEIEKLLPWFGPGSGAWYVAFQKYTA